MRYRETKTKKGGYGKKSSLTEKEIKPTYPSRYTTDKEKTKTMSPLKPTYPDRYK